jgi:hypothetical protein
MRYALVYQCGLANVFAIAKHNDMPGIGPLSDQSASGRRRTLQGAFGSCEWFCRGLEEAGHSVLIFHCDQCGDISRLDWEDGPGEMFAIAKNPPRFAA